MAEEVGARGSEIHYTLLADFYYDHSTEGDLAAGSKWEPSAKKLETNQCAEITHLVLYPPTSGGAGLDLLYVLPVIDGAGIEEALGHHKEGERDGGSPFSRVPFRTLS